VEAEGGTDPRRGIPSVEHVLSELDRTLPHGVRAELAREAVGAARRGTIEAGAVLPHARERARVLALELLGPVVNATGVLLHTNLGRAPLGASVIEAMAAASGYTNLEYRLPEGVRGSRHEHAGALLARACGAEAGIVVNNNAAAVVLVLATLARDRSVLVSRGELVEIGGGFRIPEILAETGARLVEVGTTNRTRLRDYERARYDDVAIVLKVHASNYRMTGFVSSVSVAELAGLDGLGDSVVVDSGSGLLDESTPWLRERPRWLRDELGVRQCIEAGAALVTFSGDKLLGGPQAGIIVGRRALVDRLKAHPLARALRADKVTLAGLQAVAFAYLSGDASSIPLWRMACESVDALRVRAEGIAAAVPGAKVVDTDAVAGGGTLPGLTIASCGVALEPASVNETASRLRAARVVARIDADRVVCDLRTVDPVDDTRLTAALHFALTTPTG
jgi:L-seryl-tRNA(Ser) seleniumtransferase